MLLLFLACSSSPTRTVIRFTPTLRTQLAVNSSRASYPLSHHGFGTPCTPSLGYCGYVDPSTGQGVCTAEGNGSFAYPFAPMDAILSELPEAYRVTAQYLVPPSKFRSSGYERATSKAGFVIMFIGCVTTAATFLA